MSRRFDRFIAALAATAVSPRACNQYSSETGDLLANAIRRRNLRLYLDEIDAGRPDTLLLGEAVSYRGGRLTGIAFVSESIMLAGVDGWILGAERGYRKATPGPQLSTEASATMVWQTIRNIEPLPLLWNAFPFHPFDAGDPHSNRVPTTSELETGSHFVRWLLRLFPIDTVAAVGNQAARCLAQLGIEHHCLRHPSHGGKQRFLAGMARLSQRRKS
jgi:uracil-DNA glycosylase